MSDVDHDRCFFEVCLTRPALQECKTSTKWRQTYTFRLNERSSAQKANKMIK